MYPLIQVGPFNLSTGGLLLLLAVLSGSWYLGRVAAQRGGTTLATQAERCFLPALIGAVIGGRVWYGLFNLDLYLQSPGLFVALRVSDFAWPGALLGGLLLGFAWSHGHRFERMALADSAALALPFVQVIASIGLLMSGEAFGLSTSLPWALPLFGTLRHPTQAYYAIAALLTGMVVAWIARKHVAPGTLTAVYLGLQGIAWLLIEAVRADSLVFPGGIRAAQVLGLVLLIAALMWMRQPQRIPHEPKILIQH